MSSAKQNRHIARLIVGAMSIDGTLGREEQKRVARSLESLGMPELIADVGAAIEDDDGNFNVYEECKILIESLGSETDTLAPMMFRMLADVIAHDRFVSAQEATYLSSVAKRLKLTSEQSRKIFKAALTAHRSRLEVSGKNVDEAINPLLKDLLSFDGADDLVGELAPDSMEEKLHRAQSTLAESCEFNDEDIDRSLAVLGLTRGSTFEEAEEVWRETIDTLHLPKMANLGEAYVSAAIARIARINDAYRVLLTVNEHVLAGKSAKNQVEILEKKIERNSAPTTRNRLTDALETELTGVGTEVHQSEDLSMHIPTRSFDTGSSGGES